MVAGCRHQGKEKKDGIVAGDCLAAGERKIMITDQADFIIMHTFYVETADDLGAGAQANESSLIRDKQQSRVYPSQHAVEYNT